MQHRLSKPTYRLCPETALHVLPGGSYAIWNRYFPTVRVLSAKALESLRRLPLTYPNWSRPVLAQLTRARVLQTTSRDSSHEDFVESGRLVLNALQQEAAAFFTDRHPYKRLGIINSACNLACRYCVARHGDAFREAARRSEPSGIRDEVVLRVVDEFLRGRRRAEGRTAWLSFNGGEILLRWPLIARVLAFARERYPDVVLKAQMNTNGTLMTDEIAQTLARHRVDVAFSLDGCRESHDVSRTYHDGGGSFDDALAGINRFRRSGKRRVRGVQGTIDDVTTFGLAKLQQMAEYGLDRARLDPNLLDSPAHKGRVAALWQSRMVTECVGGPVALVGSAFEGVLRRVTRRAKGYRFFCGGLMGIRPGILNLNVDRLEISQLCPFATPAAVSLEDSGYDLHSPRLVHATRSYVAERWRAVQTLCQGCEVVGTCQGGCLMSGLDIGNGRNEAACEYQRWMWRHAIDYTYAGEIREPRQGLGDGFTRLPSPDEPAAVSDGNSCR